MTEASHIYRVMEEPAEAGSLVQLAEADGVCGYRLVGSLGPFSDLMALPRHVLNGMSPARLKELARSPKLFVAKLEEEEGEGLEPDGGFHWHTVDRSEGGVIAGGGHSHVFRVAEEISLAQLGGSSEQEFVLPAGMMLLTESDGEHGHELASPVNTKEDGEHSHRILIVAGEEELSVETKADGQHAHGLMVKRSGLGGPHQHVLDLGGATLTSLSIGQLLELGPKDGPAQSDDSDVPK